MKKLLSILIFILFAFPMTGQTEQVTGQVSYRSSQHTYVRFRSTRGIEKGDTLFIQEGSNLKPALIVQSTSSTSCLCTALTDEVFPEGHILIAVIPHSEQEVIKSDKEVQPILKVETTTSSDGNSRRVQSFNGSISASSYSRLIKGGSSNQRFRYRLNANAANISGSKFSARTYMSYSHNTRNTSGTTKYRNDGLKVYDLWARYDIDSSSYLKLGRQINSRMSGTGPFDGITAQKTFNKFTAGITGGSTPDPVNYGFGPEYLQFGGYLGYDITGRLSSSSTSLALVQHTLSGLTDRRYIYFQQSAALGRKVLLFGSAEADLYDPEGKSGTLTSGYFNLNWRAAQRISINASYDARRNPVWHETYRSTLDSLIDNELRQTLRIGTDVRLNGYLNAGLRSSLRFMPGDSRQSMNLSGYLTWRNQGKSALSATLSGNYLQTSFINGYNAGITFRRNSSRLQAGAGYNFYNYALIENNQNTVRHTGHVDLFWQFLPKTTIMADYEFSYEGKTIMNQLFIQLTIRF